MGARVSASKRRSRPARTPARGLAADRHRSVSCSRGDGDVAPTAGAGAGRAAVFCIDVRSEVCDARRSSRPDDRDMRLRRLLRAADRPSTVRHRLAPAAPPGCSLLLYGRRGTGGAPLRRHWPAGAALAAAAASWTAARTPRPVSRSSRRVACSTPDRCCARAAADRRRQDRGRMARARRGRARFACGWRSTSTRVRGWRPASARDGARRGIRAARAAVRPRRAEREQRARRAGRALRRSQRRGQRPGTGGAVERPCGAQRAAARGAIPTTPDLSPDCTTPPPTRCSCSTRTRCCCRMQAR